MYGCQQVLISPGAELKAILEFVCSESNKLANCGTYYARQLYFKAGKIPTRADLHRLLKTNPHFQSLYSHVAQQTLTGVHESFKSFVGLLKGVAKGTVDQRPKLPGYKKNALKLVAFAMADVKLKDMEVDRGEVSPRHTSGLLRFPLGGKVKAWFGIDAFYLPMPSNLDYKSLREIRILPRNRCYYVEFVYLSRAVVADIDKSRCLGIDSGLNNWLTCVSNVGTNFIIDGLHLKSLNQWYNKRISVLKENQHLGFWSNRLATITEKRNRQVRDAVNKAARLVLSHCIENKIGTVVFGWNKGIKQEINLGGKTNQKFVQIPTSRLKDRIAQLCEQCGIQLVETEESYTSVASFLDGDILPVFGSKPEGWMASGKRVKRGLYRTAINQYVNADTNGAANIMRKVSTTLGINLSEVSSGDLITPKRSAPVARS